jgi:hypothetical protein
MTVTIYDTTITSDQTAHTARLAPGSQHLWEVSWLPGRAPDRNSAITAMTLADLTSERDLNERHQLWALHPAGVSPLKRTRKHLNHPTERNQAFLSPDNRSAGEVLAVKVQLTRPSVREVLVRPLRSEAG